MKRLGSIGLAGLFLLAGCQEGEFDPTAKGINGENAPAPPAANAKSFAAPPGELRTVLEQLRKETGWKLTCEPELDKELVYLKFKDKGERQIAMALGQVLLANFPEREGAITLSATHASQINEITFQNEMMRGRITPQIDARIKVAQETAFAPGTALDKLRELTSRLGGEPRTEEQQHLSSVMTPAGRATALFLARIPPADFANLKVGEPKSWATNPSGSQIKMTPEMEKLIDVFVQEAVEWNGAVAVHGDERYTIRDFSPRGDFEFRLERGDPQIQDTTTLRAQLLTKVTDTYSQPLAAISLPLEPRIQPGKPNPDPDFEKLVNEFSMIRGADDPASLMDALKLPFGMPADARLKLLIATIEYSADHADNIVANLDSAILDQMVRLTMHNRVPGTGLDPDFILARRHGKFPGREFVQIRPIFTHYARLDRSFWDSRGSGVVNSPWTRPKISR